MDETKIGYGEVSHLGHYERFYEEPYRSAFLSEDAKVETIEIEL